MGLYISHLNCNISYESGSIAILVLLIGLEILNLEILNIQIYLTNISYIQIKADIRKIIYTNS